MRLTPALAATCARLAAVLAIGTASAGCFSYVAADPEALSDGREVRVLLSRAAALRLADQGAGELVSIDDPILFGSLLHRPDGRVALRIPIRAGSIDSPGRPIVQELLLDQGDLLRVDLRRLDPTRTALAAAGAAGIATATIVLIVGGSDGELDRTNPGGTSDARIPLGSDGVR